MPCEDSWTPLEPGRVCDNWLFEDSLRDDCWEFGRDTLASKLEESGGTFCDSCPIVHVSNFCTTKGCQQPDLADHVLLQKHDAP